MSADKSSMFITAWQTLTNEFAPVPVAEYKFAAHIEYTDKAGRTRTRGWRFDWAFPEKKLAVEIDGGQWVAHGGRHSRDTDRDKLNVAAVEGWRVLRFSPQQLKRDPLACVVQVLAALEYK